MATEPNTTAINQAPSKKKYPWATIGILCSAFAIIVLLFVMTLIVFHLVSVDRQLIDMASETQLKVKALEAQSFETKTFQATLQQVIQDAEKTKATVAALSKAQNTNQESWLISEARYLIKLADAHLRYTFNLPVAIQLLQSADQALADVKDPKWIEVRQALAKDIATLESTPQIDVDGIYAKLAAVGSEIPQLPLINQPTPAQSANGSALQDQAQSTWWKRGLDNTWASLQKLVVVRYNEKGTLPILLPEQKSILYQNLYAQIAQAMWALLHGQQDIYLTSLAQFETWVKQYFVSNDAMTIAVLTQVSHLQNMAVRQAAPKIMALEIFQK